jgi:hypothetical protein
MKRVIGLGSAAASPSDRFAPHATAAIASMNLANGDLFGTTSLDERRHFGEFYEQLLNDPQSAGNATYGGYVEAIPPKAQGRGAPSKSHPPRTTWPLRAISLKPVSRS